MLSFIRPLRDMATALPPTVRGMIWMALSGLVFTVLNTIMRILTTEMDSFQTQFLRYICGVAVMMPLVLRAGVASYAPRGLKGQLWRGVIHTAGITLWFIALPHLTLADITAIGFTGPIFVMLGAVLLLGERPIWERWVASAIGFVGVMIVVAPKFQGGGGIYALFMLASAPLFAGSFLITKALTRRDRPEVIVVWQSITVSLFSFPMAALHWSWPTLGQWALFLLCGVIGSTGHYFSNRALRATEVSATQSIKFLDLIWSVLAGLSVFGDVPSSTTMLGAAVIFVSTSWIARREARRT